MANFDMYINGKMEKFSGYVIPNLAYPIILGKLWMEYNNFVQTARLGCLRINSRKHKLLVRGNRFFKTRVPHVIIGGISYLTSEKFVDALQLEQH